MEKSPYQILLYYKYVELENPAKMCDAQRALCESLGLKGRIIVAIEGINGTVEGTIENTEKYILEMNTISEFVDISYKKSEGTGSAFPKLQVRVRPEIVTTDIPHLNPNKVTGKYITAEELHSWFEEKKEFYIVDMRNEFEYASGYFEGFVPSGLKNFFELSSVIPRLAHLKNKSIVTVCTGGVRCEKASGFLVDNGFADVYQLQDGIQSYMEKYPNKHFKGKLYVFDNRLTVGFNIDQSTHEIVGKCHFCQKSTYNYANCAYDECHKHYICCIDCIDSTTGLVFCTDVCKENHIAGIARRSTLASSSHPTGVL